MLSLSSMREGGVYLLPDGERLVATHDHRGGYFLYAPKVWSKFHGWGPAEYDLMPEGLIVTCAGQKTPWGLEDLVDTGETKEPCVNHFIPPRDEAPNFYYG